MRPFCLSLMCLLMCLTLVLVACRSAAETLPPTQTPLPIPSSNPGTGQWESVPAETPTPIPTPEPTPTPTPEPPHFSWLRHEAPLGLLRDFAGNPVTDELTDGVEKFVYACGRLTGITEEEIPLTDAERELIKQYYLERNESPEVLTPDGNLRASVFHFDFGDVEGKFIFGLGDADEVAVAATGGVLPFDPTIGSGMFQYRDVRVDTIKPQLRIGSQYVLQILTYIVDPNYCKEHGINTANCLAVTTMFPKFLPYNIQTVLNLGAELPDQQIDEGNIPPFGIITQFYIPHRVTLPPEN